MSRPGRLQAPKVRIFAVEDCSVQLTWPAMATSECTIEVGGRVTTVPANPPAWLHQRGRRSRPLSGLIGGPGAAVIDGLEPATKYDVVISAPGGARRRVGAVTTLDPPPGPLLARFALVSDMHLGEGRFGALGGIREGPELGGPSAAICLKAAVGEARAWGAGLMVTCGDLTRGSHPQEFALAAQVLTSGGHPAIGVLGNHDVRHQVDGAAILAANGLRVATDVEARDLPGLRLVLVHSPMVTNHRGHLPAERMARLAELCGGAPAGPNGRPGPVAVVLHHPLTSGRLPTYPPGVPADQSARVASALRLANPSTVVLAGHRHRNRRRRVGGITVVEIGSTKDYPGQWAGYAVHEGGIRQVVRRVADPAALAWTEATGRAMGHLWGHWSPGRLGDRCWVRAW